MLGTLVRWLILTLAVWVSAYVVPGIAYDHWQNLLIAALVLGILNAFVKPILMLISLPLIFVTFGLFLVLINALLFQPVLIRLGGKSHRLARAGTAHRLVLVGAGRQPCCQYHQPVFRLSPGATRRMNLRGPGFKA